MIKFSKPMTIRKQTRLALAIASCLSAFQMQAASAACEISPNDSYEYIQRITLNGTDLSNGVTLKSDDVIELTPGYSGYAYKDSWSVWLDLNNDGDFSDTDEQVFSSSSPSNSMVSAILNFPSNINKDYIPLRILLHDESVNDDSCGYNGYGDNQDFTVNLKSEDDSGGSNFDIELTNGVSQSISGKDISAFIEVSNDATNLEINISGGSGDADLSVYFDSKLVCFPNIAGSNESCNSNDFDTQGGTYEVSVAGYRGDEFSDVSLVARYDIDSDNGKNYGSHVKWEHDSVHVKIFRFEFSDVDLQWSKSAIEADMNDIVTYFDKESYGRFDVTYEMHTEVLKINESKSGWDQRDDENEWKAYFAERLVELGETNYYNIDDNTIYMIVAPQISDFGLKGGVNPGAFRVYDDGDDRTKAGGIAHEMGHAMGLHHAQGLEAKDSVFGVENYDVERIQYGNVFSMMGNNAWEFGGFNLIYKNFFSAWDIEAEVPLISKSGTYRIYTLDQGRVRGDLGIRLKSGNGDYTYWLEYRTNDDINNDGQIDVETNGVYLNIEGYFPDEDARSYYYGVSYLLDMTPNSLPDDLSTEDDDFDDFYDSALVIGKNYTDEWGAFTITPLQKGGELGTDSAWIEINVEMH